MDILFIILIVLIIFIFFNECKFEDEEGFKNTNTNTNTNTKITDYILELESTDTPESMRLGLMNRKEPLNDYSINVFGGMLFDFKEMDFRSMWMKNTLIPLDMIFLDESNVIVGLIENAKPNNTKSLSVNKKSRYVIELNGGSISKIGLKVGDVVRDDKIVMKEN